MNLYFKNSQGKKRIIAENLSSSKEIFKHINKFLEDHNYKSYYTRMWHDGKYTIYDVGSHTEFFLVDADMMGSDND